MNGICIFIFALFVERNILPISFQSNETGGSYHMELEGLKGVLWQFFELPKVMVLCECRWSALSKMVFGVLQLILVHFKKNQMKAIMEAGF